LGQLFNRGGRLFWLHEGKLDEVTQDMLREIITKHIVTAQLMDHGTHWTCEYAPVKPSEKILRALLTGTERLLAVQRARGSNLLGRVPRA